MKLKPGCFLHYLCLDEQYCLLSVRNTVALAWYFQCLDFHGKKALNNLQFYCILRYLTDLDKSQIMLLFDLLDHNARGSIRFKDFYVTVCILLAHENHMERQFIHQHSRTAFQLLDVDGNGLITTQELQDTQFLFSFQKKELKKIFKEFDVSGDQKLNYEEFKMFAFLCVNNQEERRREEHAVPSPPQPLPAAAASHPQLLPEPCPHPGCSSTPELDLQPPKGPVEGE